MLKCLRQRSQLFQLAVDVLIERSKEFIEIERVFEASCPSAGETIKKVIRVCICFKSTYEFLRRRNKRLLNLEDNEIVLEKLFGPLSAFISRCEDLLQICYTNQQFMK